MSNEIRYVDICEPIRLEIPMKNNPIQNEVIFHRIPIYQKTVFDILNCGLFYVPSNPTIIFIGPDEMMELTMDYRYTKVDARISVKFENCYRVAGRIHDIDLVIIPHMRGVLII